MCLLPLWRPVGWEIDLIGALLFLLVAVMGPLAKADTCRTCAELQRQKLRRFVWHITLVNMRSSSVGAWQD
jgi:hypothetical protein